MVCVDGEVGGKTTTRGPFEVLVVTLNTFWAGVRGSACRITLDFNGLGDYDQLLDICSENWAKTHALEVLKNNSVYPAWRCAGAGVNVAFTSKPAFKVST